MRVSLDVTSERRKQARLSLRLPVLLFRTEFEPPTWSETLNISKDGFYCTIPKPVAPGERLRCLVALPAHGNGSPGIELCLDGQIEVVRIVTSVGKAGFEIGCRLWQYRLIPRDAVRETWALATGLDEL